MRKSSRTVILASLCGATAVSALPSEALAGPTSLTPPPAVSLNSPTTEVHYYRHYWRHHHHWGYWRPYHRHWGYDRPYRHWGYYRPYYRRYSYPYYSYGYNPAGAALGLMGAGIAAATAPRWGWGGWGPGWGGWW